MTAMERRVYSGRVTNWPLIVVATVLAVGLIAMSGLDHPDWIGLGVVALVLVVSDLTMTSVRTTAGPTGVVVRYGLLGLPRFRYRVDAISRAEAVDVPRSHMGGWGIHWSPWRGTRLTIRSGPSLRLELRNGKQVVISAEDPASAAAVVNDHVRRDREAGGS